MNAIEILLDSNRGIYIPQHFATQCNADYFDGIAQSDFDTIKNGPDTEFYWDSWENILNNATFTENGHVWRLYHDGDLFLICDDLMTDEEKVNFYQE